MKNLSKKTMKHMAKRALFQKRYASECEKRMKDADMATEREYYKRIMESANEACNKALKKLKNLIR